MTHLELLAKLPRGFGLYGHAWTRKHALVMCDTLGQAEELKAAALPFCAEHDCRADIRKVNVAQLKGPGLPPRYQWWVELWGEIFLCPYPPA